MALVMAPVAKSRFARHVRHATFPAKFVTEGQSSCRSHDLFCHQREGSPMRIKGVIVVISLAVGVMNNYGMGQVGTVDVSLAFRGSTNERPAP